jgi:hypothetical protein
MEPAGSARRFGIDANRSEDFGLFGATLVPTAAAASASEAGSGYWDHRRDPGGG